MTRKAAPFLVMGEIKSTLSEYPIIDGIILISSATLDMFILQLPPS